MRSSAEPSAVDRKDRAVDIVGGRRGEENDRARDVFGLSPAARGYAFEDRAGTIGILTQRPGVVRLDVAGRDGIDIDTGARPLVGERLGHARDRVLGGGVTDDVDATLEAEQRSRED